MKIVGRYSLRHGRMPVLDAKDLTEKRISEKEFLRRASVEMYKGANGYIRSTMRINRVITLHNREDRYKDVIQRIKDGVATQTTVDLLQLAKDDSNTIKMILFSRGIKMSTAALCMRDIDEASQYLGREITSEELAKIMNGSKRLQRYIRKNYIDSNSEDERMATPEELADYMRLIRRMVDSGRADRDNFDERYLMLDLDGNVDEEDPYAKLYEYDYSVLDNVPDDLPKSIFDVLAANKNNEKP
jgi:hypothetical protein